MRIAFWSSALLLPLLLAACAKATDPAQPAAAAAAPAEPSTISSSVEDSQTRLTIKDAAGKTYVVRVKRDEDVAPEAEPYSVEVIGELKDAAIVVAETYPSVPGGMSYCQAGEERFLRVISLASQPAAETLQVKIASCRDNLELASPGLEWAPESSSVRIHWLSGPDGPGKPQERTIRIGRDGKAS